MSLFKNSQNNNTAYLLCESHKITGCFALHRLLQPVESVAANCGASVAVATAFDEKTSKISREEERGLTTHIGAAKSRIKTLIWKLVDQNCSFLHFFSLNKNNKHLLCLFSISD